MRDWKKMPETAGLTPVPGIESDGMAAPRHIIRLTDDGASLAPVHWPADQDGAAFGVTGRLGLKRAGRT